jgi:hypothetical protein
MFTLESKSRPELIFGAAFTGLVPDRTYFLQQVAPGLQQLAPGLQHSAA